MKSTAAAVQWKIFEDTGGIWRLISQNKNMFAAVLVASGRARDVSASAFENVPVYMTAGSDEEPPIGRIVSWAQELKDAGCTVKFDVLDGLEHGDACVQAFTPERLEWVFSHTLKKNEMKLLYSRSKSHLKTRNIYFKRDYGKDNWKKKRN